MTWLPFWLSYWSAIWHIMWTHQPYLSSSDNEGFSGSQHYFFPSQGHLEKCGVIFLLFSCSVLSDSFVTSWTVACQAPLPMEFPRLEYWSGLPFPSPGDLPDTGIEPRSPVLQADTLTSEPPVGKERRREKWGQPKHFPPSEYPA